MAGTGIYGELLKAQLENLASDPASTSVGRLYWNTSTQSARIYTSSGWDDLGGGGSGASGRNYLADWFDGDRDPDPGSVTSGITATGNITISTTSWQASDTLKLTVARTSSSPLRQTYSILLDHVDVGAAFVQTPCFLLDAADLGKPVTVSFDVANVVTSDDYQVYAVRYTSGGTYQEQITIAGTASATSPYSARIPTGTTKFQGFFIAGSTSTDYYVIRFYRNSASDTTDIKVDSLYAGPEKVVQGAAVTDWVSYTPTLSNSTNATVPIAMWRRVGDSMQIKAAVAWGGAGGGTNYTISLPSGYTTDSAKVNGSGYDQIGSAMWYDAGTSYKSLEPYISSSTVAFREAGTTNIWDGTQAANGDYIAFDVTVPIVGWSSNVTMADRAVEHYIYNSSGITSAGASDTSAFAYGAGGVAIGSIASTTTTESYTTFRVRSQVPLTPSTSYWVEICEDPTNSPNTWYKVGTGRNVSNTNRQSGCAYGVGIEPVSGSNTDLDVKFGNAGRVSSGATYGIAGAPWVSTYKWRVRIVEGGAVVGYPIGARNIVGDVSGTTVPAGYIGEIKEASGSPVTPTSGQYSDGGNAGVYVTKGTYIFYVRSAVTPGTMSAVTRYLQAVSTSSGNAFADAGELNYRDERPASHTPSGSVVWTFTTAPILVTSDATYYPKVQIVGTIGTGVVANYIRAVRIA